MEGVSIETRSKMAQRLDARCPNYLLSSPKGDEDKLLANSIAFFLATFMMMFVEMIEEQGREVVPGTGYRRTTRKIERKLEEGKEYSGDGAPDRN